MQISRKIAELIFFTLLVLLLFAGSAYATSTGMPWEGPLDNILSSVSGPVARVIGAIAIIAFGLGIAFSEGGSGLRKGLWVILGLTITFNAVAWGLSFVGYGGGLTI
jgi:type IV secretory pathway VirB2 component (pilin)